MGSILSPASQTSTGRFVHRLLAGQTLPNRERRSTQFYRRGRFFTPLSFLSRLRQCPRNSERAARYLLAQQEPPEFGVTTEIRGDIVIHPDVDDTSVSWAALERFGVTIPSAGTETVRASRNENGLFTTWIGLHPAGSAIDSRDYRYRR